MTEKNYNEFDPRFHFKFNGSNLVHLARWYFPKAVKTYAALDVVLLHYRLCCTVSSRNCLTMSNECETKSSIVGPLNFTSSDSSAATEPPASAFFKRSVDVQCLLCDTFFNFFSQKDEYLAHLYLEHRLIIGDEDQVALFDDYLIHWRHMIDGDSGKLAEYCTTMMMDQLPDGTPSKNEKYFLLCDVLPQDNELRQKLHVKRLEAVLAHHQYERKDTTFQRSCLYCRDEVNPTRSAFLEHLFSKHFLQLGKSDNLVFIDELIDTVQEKMDSLLCLFCEKKFKDRPTLKEHMRKKGHKRINPDNKSYDKFFLINYRNDTHQHGNRHRTKNPRIQHRTASKAQSTHETAGHEQAKPKQRNTSSVSSNHRESTLFDGIDSDSDWSDWEGDKQVVTCLFCTRSDVDFDGLKEHMRAEHEIDFDRRTAGMTFYDRVKIVNFIRRKIHLLHCVKCDAEFGTSGELQTHMKLENHCDIGDRKQWDVAEYFFPTYEDDAFLCLLDDTCDSETSKAVDSSVVVHSEDPKLCINADAEALSKEQLLDF